MKDKSVSQLPPELVMRVKDLCDRFENDWVTGRRPRLEDFLVSPDATEYKTLLQKLVFLDARYRRQAGEIPRAADYSERFPDVVAAWFANPVGEPTVAGHSLKPTSVLNVQSVTRTPQGEAS